MVTIEKIDEVIKRVPNVTYAKAKQALLDTEGDVIEAVILLETKVMEYSKTKKTMEEVLSKDVEDVKAFIKKCNVVRVIIEKNDKTIMNIPITVGVVGLALGPLATLTGLAMAVLGKCEIKIQNEEDGKVLDLGEFSEEKVNMIKQALSSIAKEAKDIVNHNKEESKDITDELIKENDDSRLD